MRNLLPIRKVAVAAVGGGLTWLALRAGMDLGSAEANQAASVLVALGFAYAEKDPRVRDVEAKVEAVLGKVEGAE